MLLVVSELSILFPESADVRRAVVQAPMRPQSRSALVLYQFPLEAQDHKPPHLPLKKTRPRHLIWSLQNLYVLTAHPQAPLQPTPGASCLCTSALSEW